MKEPTQTRGWTVDIALSETTDETEAKATLDAGDVQLGGWGRSRRNPDDPEVPRIGEELAAARALNDLAHKLLEVAAAEIERFEGGRVDVHG